MIQIKSRGFLLKYRFMKLNNSNSDAVSTHCVCGKVYIPCFVFTHVECIVFHRCDHDRRPIEKTVCQLLGGTLFFLNFQYLACLIKLVNKSVANSITFGLVFQILLPINHLQTRFHNFYPIHILWAAKMTSKRTSQMTS